MHRTRPHAPARAPRATALVVSALVGPALAGLFGGCYQVTEQPNLVGQDLSLTVLHTSDMHSRLLPYDQTPGLIDRNLGLCAELLPFGGVSRMQWILKRERARSQRVLHLDSGDHFQGAPIFNQFRGEVEVRTMAEMRPDGVVIGNHEFDLGARTLAEQYERWGVGAYPLLAANYVWSDPSDPINGTNLPLLAKPYEIRNYEGLRIAIIGMGNTSSMTSIALGGNSLGITPLEPVEILRSHVAALEPQVDLIFIVSHMGLGARREVNLAEDTEMVTGYERIVPPDRVLPNWEVVGSEANGQVRVRVPGIVGIDAIFGGHLHIVLNPPKYIVDPEGRKVPLIHSGAFTKFVGRADLVVRMPKTPTPRGAEVISVEYDIFPVTNRIPKASPSSVVACPADGAPTFAVEEGVDDYDDVSVCGTLSASALQVRVCEVADECRLKGDACTDACRRARRDCTSVPAPVDTRMRELLDGYVQTLYQRNYLNRGFVYATSRIDRFGQSGEDSPLGNLVADAMRLRNRVEADFSMTNSLGIRTNMEAGLVTAEQMFNIFPFENTITTVYLSGVEVQEVFDFATQRSSERGCQTQIQVSGIELTMDCAQALRNQNATACTTAADCTSEEAQAAVGGDPNAIPSCVQGRCFKHPARDIRIQGRALVETESYKAAVNDFIGRGGSGFDVLRRNTTKVESTLSLRDALVDHMRKTPEAGGPGRVCGSPFMVEPIPRPVRPYATIMKADDPMVTCASRPSGCTPATGRFVDCTEDDVSARFYCIPHDFRDPSPAPGDECAALAEVTPIFETIERPASEAGQACRADPGRACPGSLHCCERTTEAGVSADFYCVVPVCLDPPATGRLTRVVQ